MAWSFDFQPALKRFAGIGVGAAILVGLAGFLSSIGISGAVC